MLESIGVIALVAVISGGIGASTVPSNELTQEEMVLTADDQIVDQEAMIKNSTIKWYDQVN